MTYFWSSCEKKFRVVSTKLSLKCAVDIDSECGRNGFTEKLISENYRYYGSGHNSETDHGETSQTELVGDSGSSMLPLNRVQSIMRSDNKKAKFRTDLYRQPALDAGMCAVNTLYSCLCSVFRVLS